MSGNSRLAPQSSSSNITETRARVRSSPSRPETAVREKWNRIQKAHPSASAQTPAPQSFHSYRTGSLSDRTADALSCALPVFGSGASEETRRAREASFVFTIEGGQRVSPPLEAVLYSSCGDDASAPPPREIGTGTVLNGDASNQPAAQVAEALDLRSYRRIFAASRQQQQQQQQQYYDAYPVSGGVAHRVQQEQTPLQGDSHGEAQRMSLASSTLDSMTSKASKFFGRRSNDIIAADENTGSIAQGSEVPSGFNYKVIKLRKNVDEEDEDEDEEAEGSLANERCCFCCFFAPFVGSAPERRGDGTIEEALVPSLQSTPNRRSCRCNRCWVCKKLLRFGKFMNIWTGDVPRVSQAFCILNYLAGLLVTLATCLLLVTVFGSSRRSTVGDGSACQGHDLKNSVTPDVAFSIACFILNGVVCMAFSVRAVRYENKGLLICHFISVVLQICRVVYVVFIVNPDYLGERVEVCVEVILITHAALLLISCFLYRWVSQSFGWRTFMKGITQTSRLEGRRRSLYVQSCVQLDIICTLNACVAVIFVVNSSLENILGLTLTCVSCTVALFFPPVLRLRCTWFLVVFGSVGALSLAFYCYAVSSLVEPYFIRHADKNFEVSDCYRKSLYSCLHERDMCVVWEGSAEGSSNGSGSEPNTIVNDTNTFIPTLGKRHEYFEIRKCDANCFSVRGHEFLSHIEYCCFNYGRCRLNDAVRRYGALHLALLAAIVVIVRIILVRLAMRIIHDSEDEKRKSMCQTGRVFQVSYCSPQQFSRPTTDHFTESYSWEDEPQTIRDSDERMIVGSTSLKDDITNFSQRAS